MFKSTMESVNAISAIYEEFAKSNSSNAWKQAGNDDLLFSANRPARKLTKGLAVTAQDRRIKEAAKKIIAANAALSDDSFNPFANHDIPRKTRMKYQHREKVNAVLEAIRDLLWAAGITDYAYVSCK